ncbi:hypothetical protein KXD40_008154 [Peronospora effusa]|uniref:DUF423 domain-containing protein n=1 Tax=Peronospora effusa TaxID=542832 RepID=A0A3M6V9E1_9STRA|nr:hypothetical protein DD238_007359 [Peronospora effusa]RQM08944.1 hypothetical protein DD237_006268 [Peronospora effusa]UIZ24159.1 hypothetical protein KXD40_008154 [Peronospora effusa]
MDRGGVIAIGEVDKRSTRAMEMLGSGDRLLKWHLVHSVVLLATPMCRRPGLAGGLIATGTMLFSGSLYAMTLTGEKKLGMITPIGGVAMVAGWLALML